MKVTCYFDDLVVICVKSIFFVFGNFNDSSCSGCILVKNERKVELSAPKESFSFKSATRGCDQQVEYTFSEVFTEKTTQEEIFHRVMLPFVNDVIGGQNGLCFAHGVTNSGKVRFSFCL